MIELAEWKEGNPFERHPSLRDIWPQPYLRLAEEATLEEMERRSQDPTQNSGPLFLIRRVDKATGAAEVIGITGFFIWNEEATELGLRWHGLIPSERGQGLSRAIVDTIAAFGAQMVPQALRLMELVPCSDYGRGIEAHFQKIGFKPQGPQESHDWSDHPWQAYARDLAPAPLPQPPAASEKEAPAAPARKARM